MRTLRERVPSIVSVGWMTAVWVFLWGEVTLGNVVNGLLLAFLVGFVFPLPAVGGISTFRPLAFVVLAGRFGWDILSSGFRVAMAALRPGITRSGVIRVQLRSHSDFVLATTASMTTLIPGSVAINTHRITGVIYLHVFDVPEKGHQKYLDNFRVIVLRQEERLLRAFASEAELADAGYKPGWRVGSGDVPGWLEQHGAREHRAAARLAGGGSAEPAAGARKAGAAPSSSRKKSGGGRP
nr:Na+/H+ antiporter subunit E [Actinomycetales bacterium]